MKDFAKSIRTGNEYKPGTYDPRRHEINIMKIDYEISKWRQVISGEKQRIASLERMVSSGDYGKMTAQELKEAKRNLEAAYMRLDQALSMKKRATGNSEVGNSSHTKEEAKTKDEYFKILKFYQTQGYRTKAGEYNPNGRIKLHKGDDSVEIVLVGNSKVGNEYKPDIRITPADLSRKLKQAKNISEIDDIDDEIEYDLREYENAIDECKLKIKDYERSMSALRMIQRDVSDARRNLK